MKPSTGPQNNYWRSLEELADTPQFREFLAREFPQAASEFPTGISRRRWLQVMGASLALGTLAGCRWEKETILPLAERPANRTPGTPQRFATTLEVAGGARPLLVTSLDGRPLKVEGNPAHPDSRGGTDAFSQAQVLELYDPDRGHTLRQRESGSAYTRTWEQFATWFDKQAGAEGAGVAVLAAPSTSPSRAQLRERFEERFPKARWYEHTSLDRRNEEQGTAQAFGKPYRSRLKLDQAAVIACFDADPLGNHPGSVTYARDFVAGRDADQGRMNRLYAIEAAYTTTGVAADHRLPLGSGQIESFLASLEARVQKLLDDVKAGKKPAAPTGPQPAATDIVARRERFLDVLAIDLVENAGKSLVVVGPQQPAAVHARAHRINNRLGNIGKTVEYWEADIDARAGTIDELAAAAGNGEVTTLLVLDGNPVYDAPAELNFAEVLAKLENSAYLGLYENETGQACQWYLPQAHGLETWGDAVSEQGIYSVAQPLIDPLYDGKSQIEVLALLTGDDRQSGRDLVRRTWSSRQGNASDRAWRKLVHDGFAEDSRPAPADAKLQSLADLDVPADDAGAAWRNADIAADKVEVVFLGSNSLYDGRYANLSWLQELPDRLTKVTWGNAALVGPATAAALNVEQGQNLQIEINGNSVVVPVYLLPGMARGSVGLTLGYGRTAAGHVGGSEALGIETVGVNVAPVRTRDAWYIAAEAKATPLNTAAVSLATTQDHQAIDTVGLEAIGHRIGALVREGTFDDYRKFLEEHHPGHPAVKSAARAPAGTVAHEGKVHQVAAKSDDSHSHGDEHHGEHHASFPPQEHHHPPLISLWEEVSYEGQAWGMSIDLNKCIGCNACMVACQAENNVPVVGKEQIEMGREMHWLRIDRYFSGDVEEPQVVTQPVTCHHCENAPCEQVCPVAATVHSDEGLNDMAYNRCIGTRYCANNCPYKVRRFNFFDYRDHEPRLQQANDDLTSLLLNPEVTVRMRGVMEKCTYCVQRIQNAKITARREGRPLGPDEIVTACQQACSTQAIEFGDLNRSESKVAQAHRNPRAYAMLEELNIKPRTRYLARIRNPHPALIEGEAASAAGTQHA